MKNFKLLICICAILLNFTSCDSDVYSEYASQELGIFNQEDDTPKTWQEQLANIMYGELSTFYQQQQLKLEKYEIITSEEETINYSSFLPFYSDTIHYNNFTIKRLEEINQLNNQLNQEYYLNRKKIILEENKDKKLKTIRLHWQYKEHSFTTECLVSEESVIYDNLLSNIHFISIEKRGERAHPSIRRTKSASENGTPISYHVQGDPIHMRDGAGRTMTTAYYYVQVIGHEDAGNKYIDNYQYEAPAVAHSGLYSAKGKIQVISSETGLNGHFEYQYAYAVGTSDISITFLGSGFTISGATQERSGGERVNASQLEEEY